MKNIFNDKGIAMVTVIGILSIITILIFSVVWYSEQAMNVSVLNKNNTVAYQIANAAIDKSLADMQANGFSSDRYPMTGELNGGTYTITVTSIANSEYKVEAVGIDASGAQEKIVVKFFYMNLWDMNFAAGSNQSLTAGGGGINGTSNVTGPFYVRGSIELAGGAYIHDGPLFVKDGDVILRGASEIGESSKPINVYVTGKYPATNFYASSISQAVPSISLPVLDDNYIAEKYASAKVESVDNIMGYPSKSTATNIEAEDTDPTSYTTLMPPSTATWTRNKAIGASDYYKIIDNNNTPEPIGTGTTDLVIGGTGSWGTWYGDGHTTTSGQHDDFAFDDSTNMLYVEGTVFVDGDIYVNEDITYVGNGSLIANGDIYLEGECIPYNIDLNPAEALGFISPNIIYVNTSSSNKKPDPGVVPDISGAFFAKEAVDIDGNVYIKGSVIAGSIRFGHPNAHLVTNPLLPSFLPESMPGKGMHLLSKGVWTRP